MASSIVRDPARAGGSPSGRSRQAFGIHSSPDSPGPLGVNDLAANQAKLAAPPERSKWRVYLGWQQGKPVIFEYTRAGDRCAAGSMMFGTERKRRAWYEVGDLISHTELPERDLLRIYPELAETGSSGDSLLLDVALAFLLGPPSKYKVAKKILSIEPDSGGDGGGYVTLMGVLILDSPNDGPTAETAFIELERRSGYTRTDLNFEWWFFDRLVRGLAWVEPVANMYAEVAIAIATGVARSGLKMAGRTVFRLTLKEASTKLARRAAVKKAIQILSRDSVKYVASGCAAYAAAFAKAIAEGMRSQKMQLLATKSDPSLEERKSAEVTRAHIRGTGAFVSAIISASLTPSLKRVIEESGQSKLMQEIVIRVTKPLTIGQATMLVDAVTAAAAKSMTSPGQFEANLAQALLAEITGMAKDLFKLDWQSIGAALLSES